MTRRRLLRGGLAAGLGVAVAASVALAVLPASAASTLYEAEAGTISQGTVDANHAGFTGAGFVNYANVAGGYFEITVDVPVAGGTALVFRYANSSGGNRPTDVTVDGNPVGTIPFANTGSWTTWQTASVSTTLTAGSHTVRATATGSGGGPNVDSVTVTDGSVPPAFDYTVAVADSEESRHSPSTIGGWGYTQGLFLWGTYLLYQRTHDVKYLNFMRTWANRFISADGTISNSFTNLDSMNSANVALALNREFPTDTRYKKVADKVRNRLDSYTRTSDGGWWHSTSGSRDNQLWGDGVFMVLPFLVRYGQQINNRTFPFDGENAYGEAVKQLKIYYGHLRNPANELLKHAYDGSPAGQKASWANPTTGQAPETWCRAEGWFSMTLIEVLEIIPLDQPGRADLITMLQRLVPAFARYQDPASGRWWQVVDKGTVSGNWTETSCSSMYTYVISRSVERGYVDASYQTVADKGYAGVLARVRQNGSRYDVTTISEGTNVGNLAYYFGRAQNTNDLHGLGAFLIMNEQLRRFT